MSIRRHRPQRPRRGRPHGGERPSAAERGYDWAWHKLAKEYKAEHPLCEIQALCDGAPTVEVDHIVPFEGTDDPLRLDKSNLQAACGSCHKWKTRRQIRQ